MANIDKRLRDHPVARFEVAQHAVVNGSSAAISRPCQPNMRMVGHTVITSDVANGITYTLAILDSNNAELYSLAAIAENQTATGAGAFTSLTRDNDVYIPDGCTVTITPSGDPGSNGTVDVILYGV